MADYGIHVGKLFCVGLVSVILTIDFVVGLQALYYWQLNQAETSEDLFRPSAKLKTLLDAQQTRLTDYRIVDAKKGSVAIPIGRAMELVVTELSQRVRANGAQQGESP
jgi:hypothetical protein